MWIPGFILDNFSVFFCLLILAYSFFAKVNFSSVISLTVWVMLGLVMAFATSFIFDFASANREYVYLIWYGSWCAFDIIGVLLLLFMHDKYKINPSKFTIFVSFSFVILAIFQGVGYMDRAVFETRKADDFYRYMILAVNIAIVPMAFMVMWNDLKMRCYRNGYRILKRLSTTQKH